MEISELGPSPNAMAGALRDGVEMLDLNQEVNFQVYTQVILPLDRYVFWQPTVKVCVKGSLHYTQESVQNEDESLGLATVTFTSENQIIEFTSSPSNTLYVGQWGPLRFAFASQQGFYTQAGLWHYSGFSVIPAFASQLLDTPGAIDPTRAVTSNSLPLWLALNNYVSPFFDGWSNPSIPLYPSFLIPENATPPYAAVHIDPDRTRVLQAFPALSRDRSSSQLAADSVRVTLYGLQSNEAIDFFNCVLAYSLNTDRFGLMNTPAIRDGKRVATHLDSIAMQKFIDFEVSYYQSRVDSVSRQLILSAIPTFLLGNPP